MNESIEAQARAVRAAHLAARRSASAPIWYWIAVGFLMAAGVFAVSTGIALLGTIAGVLIVFGGAALDSVLARTHGIRISRVFKKSIWMLTVPWLLCLIGITIAARSFIGADRVTWMAVAAAVLAFMLTLVLGLAQNQARPRSSELPGS